MDKQFCGNHFENRKDVGESPVFTELNSRNVKYFKPNNVNITGDAQWPHQQE